jgi:hypothetical protein
MGLFFKATALQAPWFQGLNRAFTLMENVGVCLSLKTMESCIIKVLSEGGCGGGRTDKVANHMTLEPSRKLPKVDIGPPWDGEGAFLSSNDLLCMLVEGEILTGVCLFEFSDMSNSS